MYVCICNAITDKQIREAAESGTTDLWGLQAELGVATGCGSCKQTATEILAEYQRPAPVADRPNVAVNRPNVGADPVRDFAAGPQVYVPALA